MAVLALPLLERRQISRSHATPATHCRARLLPDDATFLPRLLIGWNRSRGAKFSFVQRAGTNKCLRLDAGRPFLPQMLSWRSARRSRLFLSHDFGANGVRRSHLVTLLEDDESLQIGLASRDRFLIPFKTNARHVRNVKQSVMNFIGLL